MQRSRLAIMLLSGFAGASIAHASPHDMKLNPVSLNFYGLDVGFSLSQSYTIQNTGEVQLVVMDMNITGPDANQFHFDGEAYPFCGNGRDCTPNFRLAPGLSRPFAVVCAPSHVGFFTATLTVTSNAGDHHNTIALGCAGNAPASMSTLTFSPASLDFGVNYAEPPFPSSVDRTLTVTNTAPAPSDPVVFQVVAPGTSGNGYFTVVSGDYGYVGPGESQDFVIRFNWYGGVLATAPLVLQSIDPAQPSISVPMFAEAAYGRLVFDNLSGGALSMPPVAAGETSTFTINAHNSGDFPLGIPSAYAFVSFGGTAYMEGPDSLDPGQSGQWTVVCTPDGSEGAEDGAFGYLEFDYYYSAVDFDTFSLDCPILSSPMMAATPGAQLGHTPSSMRVLRETDDPAITRGAAGSVPESGGCSAMAPTSLGPLGLIALGLIVPRRRTARRANPSRGASCLRGSSRAWRARRA